MSTYSLVLTLRTLQVEQAVALPLLRRFSILRPPSSAGQTHSVFLRLHGAQRGWVSSHLIYRRLYQRRLQ
jgi:hypothetical protein